MKAKVCLFLVASALLAAPAFSAPLIRANSPSTPVSPAFKYTPTVQGKIFNQPSQTVNNCIPVHRIAHQFDYCTNTPILH